MGNAFLQEMKAYDKQRNEMKQSKEWERKSNTFKTAKMNVAIKQMRYGLDRAVHSEMNTGKNLAAHEKLQRDIERSNQR